MRNNVAEQLVNLGIMLTVSFAVMPYKTTVDADVEFPMIAGFCTGACAPFIWIFSLFLPDRTAFPTLITNHDYWLCYWFGFSLVAVAIVNLLHKIIKNEQD